MAKPKQPGKNKRRVKGRILILCNGKTEEYYFKFLKSRLPKTVRQAVDVKVNRSKKPDLVSLVNEAARKKDKAEKESNPFDEIWLVFDHDNDSHIQEVFIQANTYQFKIAHSCICLEQWFLLHFEENNARFHHCENAEKALQKHYQQYQKPGDEQFYNLLYKNQQNAIERAKILEKNSPPDTSVRLIFVYT